MAVATGLVCVEKKYSYQHIQGVMLVNLNKQAYKLNLSHSAYRVMANLISFWNINTRSAYPSIEILAKQCDTSKRTVMRQLTTLRELGLILVVNSPGRPNKYFFSKKLTGDILEPSTSDTCGTAHVMNPFKFKQIESLCYYDASIQININKKTRILTRYPNITPFKSVLRPMKQSHACAST